MHWDEQQIEAPGQPPGQFFNVSTAKAQLSKAARRGLDSGTHSLWCVCAPTWVWRICCLTSLALEASFQLTEVYLWGISTTVLSEISQKSKNKSTECQKLVEVKIYSTAQRGDAACAPRAWCMSQCIRPATQPTRVPGSALLTVCCFWAAYECVNHRCSSWAAEPYCALHWVGIRDGCSWGTYITCGCECVYIYFFFYIYIRTN